MNSLLIKLMLISAFIQLGISLSDVSDCASKRCQSRIERAARDGSIPETSFTLYTGDILYTFY